MEVSTIRVTFSLNIPKETVIRIIEGNMKQNSKERCKVRFQKIEDSENVFYITADTATAFYQIGITAALLLEKYS